VSSKRAVCFVKEPYVLSLCFTEQDVQRKTEYVSVSSKRALCFIERVLYIKYDLLPAGRRVEHRSTSLCRQKELFDMFYQT